MPVYEYEHLEESECELYGVFETVQSIHDKPLERCPRCQAAVRKRISAVGLSFPKGNTAIKDMGFTKLVKRDNGVYENVTRRDGESRYMKAGQMDTLPNLKKIIRD